MILKGQCCSPGTNISRENGQKKIVNKNKLKLNRTVLFHVLNIMYHNKMENI